MMHVPVIRVWLMAAASGGLASLGLLLGALAGLYAPLKHRGSRDCGYTLVIRSRIA